MKRPQGFDQPLVQPPPVPQRTGPRGRAARRPVPSEASEASQAPEDFDRKTEPIVADEGRRSEFVLPEPLTPAARDEDPAAALRKAHRNRKRFERQEVRRFTKRTRRRKLVWLGASGAMLLVIAVAVLVAFSPLMSLRTIQVEGASRVSAAAVKDALKGQLGRPLALVSASAIRPELSPFTLIRSYSVEAMPPGTLVVRIVEREPIGVVQSGSRFEVVDAAHVTISSGSARPPGLPLINVPGAPGGANERATFTAVSEVLASLPAALSSRVDTVSATTPDDVTFTLGSGGPTVVWGGADSSDLKATVLDKLMATPAGSASSQFDVSSPRSPITR